MLDVKINTRILDTLYNKKIQPLKELIHTDAHVIKILSGLASASHSLMNILFFINLNCS
jgi:hypothetical protein